MDETDICYLSAYETARLIKRKEVSPVEVTQAVLDRVERLDSKLNAFAYVAADQALADAKMAEDKVMRGETSAPLLGVPTTIKDHVDVVGMPTEFGSHLWSKGEPQKIDNPVVTRLREAGVVILGKTTMPEFGWMGVSNSPKSGITHNPWKHGYNAGASSAGAAVAAAAGFGALHQGSDGAGSIRMPSHFSGIYGIKPTYGRIPQIPLATADYIVHLGPMTRTVTDAALMLKAMAGPHPEDHSSLESPPVDYPSLLNERRRPLRVAYSPDLGHARVDSEVAQLVADAVRVFESDLGFEVDEVTPAWGPKGPEIERFLWPAHHTDYADLVARRRGKMDPGLVACIEEALPYTVAQYQKMRARKYAYTAEIHRFFNGWDFLLTPAVSVAAFPADKLQPEHWPQHPWDWLSWAEFSYPFNLAQNPAASVPCGFTSEGLPVGLQIVGRRFDDLGVLQMSAAFEAARPWADKRPSLK